MTADLTLLLNVHVAAAYFVYIIGMMLCLLIYTKVRPSSYSLITDFYYALIIVLWGPLMLICLLLKFPGNMQPAVSLISQPELIAKSLYALLVGFMSVTLGLVATEIISPIKARLIREHTRASHNLVGVLALAYCMLIIVSVFASEDGRSLLSQGIQFTQERSSELYRFIRREAYEDSTFLGTVMARLRYSVNALMFTLCAIYLFRWLSPAGAIVTLIVSLPILVCSLSKAPYVYYGLYLILAYMLMRMAPRRLDKQMVRRAGVMFCFSISALVMLYTVQYAQGVDEGTFSRLAALELAFYRLFGAGADGLRLHLAAFPDYLDFGFGSGIGLLAALFGQEARDYAAEVVALDSVTLVGRTTYQALFVGQAFGDFGYVGIVLYGTILGIYLSTVQRVVTWLSIREIRVACMATMLPNLSFLLTLPASSSLLSYGVASIPITAFVLERLVKLFTSERTVRQPVRVGT